MFGGRYDILFCPHVRNGNTSLPLATLFIMIIFVVLVMSSAQRIGSKRLFLFTNEDDPHSNDISLRSASKVRAKDLQEFGIKIELFDMDKPMQKFHRTNFYKVRCYCRKIVPDSSETDNSTLIPIYLSLCLSYKRTSCWIL